MEETKSYKSWTISDELWEVIKGEIPKYERDPEKTYKNKTGQGRPPLPPRKALEGILYVLRTGCQWKAVPKEFGSGSAVHHKLYDYLRNLCKFERISKIPYYRKSLIL